MTNIVQNPGFEDGRGPGGVPPQWQVSVTQCTSDADCNDDNLCTTDTCNLANGQCVFTPIDCNDNNACTVDSYDDGRRPRVPLAGHSPG